MYELCEIGMCKNGVNKESREVGKICYADPT